MIYFLQDWLHQQTWLEIIGVVTGLLCVALAAINNIWNWPIAIVSVGIFIFIFFKAHLYADMGLQVYFMLMNIYGWYYWSQAPDEEEKTPVLIVTKTELIYAGIAVVIFTFILGSLLKYTPASFPFLDSFCAACSLVGRVFLARKVLENWLIWIFVNIIYIGIFIFKHLELTAIMYGVYVILALWGYFDWRREYKRQVG
ncbi:nicotinamide riboside transporter PnuC [Mucilaginibacter gotjawali]|uniref:Nicotinamide mononucleotide transporter n=2 Tax=Mucilaginibacter gotjawali TaxID=1550579 RepID=A0A839SJF1_9SPHI|nr:nicotinamide riboside transporter PnuC [Mucilaginibacter gotjawali]MBB3057966.1 nicotinamide mononucleotide transporter [Mucilaginibacter gotjawali]BAU52262.1 Nicotinamide riboside transporter PnuC [Mucilaginibacter gotjawali]